MRKGVRGFPQYSRATASQFSPLPNILLDEILPRLPTEAQLKVLLMIAYKTYGQGKESEAISLAELEEMTGMSRKAVVRGITELEKQGYILVQRERGPGGRPVTNVYRLGIQQDDGKRQAAVEGRLHIL